MKFEPFLLLQTWPYLSIFQECYHDNYYVISYQEVIRPVVWFFISKIIATKSKSLNNCLDFIFIYDFILDNKLVVSTMSKSFIA